MKVSLNKDAYDFPDKIKEKYGYEINPESFRCFVSNLINYNDLNFMIEDLVQKFKYNLYVLNFTHEQNTAQYVDKVLNLAESINFTIKYFNKFLDEKSVHKILNRIMDQEYSPGLYLDNSHSFNDIFEYEIHENLVENDQINIKNLIKEISIHAESNNVRNFLKEIQ